ncbi:MAG: DmsE family decaheme c-type cytochrome [Pyrinomonadaceae bacterium]
MASTKNIKLALLGIFTLILVFWGISGTFSRVDGNDGIDSTNIPEVLPNTNDDDYVGSESCRDCHEDQFKSFSETKHAKLSQLASWKGKVQGCESCHGPGKDHLEDATDLTKIISFKNKTSKEISETCLTCHAGKEDHNKFRRSDHWRNNVGCTDCHTAHGAESHPTQIGSVTLAGINSDNKPGTGTLAMLKVSEPQLCLSCHNEMKAQFSQPFHHKVLEGQMKCSDCHNAHGEFELKNARLAVGGDAACVKCHTDKKGPFVYEHLPITVEGCATCHNTHGSANPKMLKRNQVRQLCLECHSSIFEDLAPNAPSFHRQDNVRYQNCTICHVKIHGSQTHPVFFR